MSLLPDGQVTRTEVRIPSNSPTRRELRYDRLHRNGQTFNQNPPAFYDPGVYTVSVVVSREGYKDWEGSAVVEIKEYVIEPLATPTILTGVGSGVYVSAGTNRHEITWVRLRVRSGMNSPIRITVRRGRLSRPTTHLWLSAV